MGGFEFPTLLPPKIKGLEKKQKSRAVKFKNKITGGGGGI